MRAALYARVSTSDQTTDTQLHELRKYAEARCWSVTEYTDTISGARDRRPALDRLVKDARRRRVDVVAAWRLDRLGRNLKHLVTLLDEWQAVGVSFVSLGCQRRAKTAHLWRLKIAHLQTQVTSLRPSYPPSVRAVSMWLGRWFSAG